MTPKNLNDLDGQHFKGEKVNLLFYTPLGQTDLHAQFYLNDSEEVIHEEIVKGLLTANTIIKFFRSNLTK